MRTVLIDTSGPYSLAAVAENQVLMGSSAVHGRPAAQIHEIIRKLLVQVGMTIREIDAVVVTTGPGSWTGLNIGVTAAKVMAQILHLRVVGISALDALTVQHQWTGGPVWAICKAGRQRCYYAQYACDTEGRVTLPPSESGILDLESLIARLQRTIGTSCVIEYGSEFNDVLLDQSSVEYLSCLRLTPEGMIRASLANESLAPEKVFSLVPDYLQPSLAERDAKN